MRLAEIVLTIAQGIMIGMAASVPVLLIVIYGYRRALAKIAGFETSNKYCSAGWARAELVEIARKALRYPVPTNIARRERFEEIYEEWRRSSAFHSGINHIMEKYEQPREIVGMGTQALPWIFEKMRGSNSGWGDFAVIQAITGVAPHSHNDQGNYDAMCRSWLKWWDDMHQMRTECPECHSVRVTGVIEEDIPQVTYEKCFLCSLGLSKMLLPSKQGESIEKK